MKDSSFLWGGGGIDFHPVSNECGMGVWILCPLPWTLRLPSSLQCSWHTYGYVFQFALKQALKALHCILYLYLCVDIGRGVTGDCSPSRKGYGFNSEGVYVVYVWNVKIMCS